MSASRDYVSLAISLFGSFVAVYITPDALFHYTTHGDLWVLLFFILFIFVSMFAITYSYLYSEVKHDIGWNSRQLLFSFIQMTLLMFAIRLAMDAIGHEIATENLTMIDYMGFFYFAIILIFVILLNMQALLEQSSVEFPSSAFHTNSSSTESLTEKAYTRQPLLPLDRMQLQQTTKISKNITVLEQHNIKQRYPNLLSKVQCQNMTDIWGFPTYEAADDAVIPGLQFFRTHGVEAGVHDCSALTFSWTTIRTKNDITPYYITLSFWRHDPSSNTPSPSEPFYKKTLLWPTNNQRWEKDVLNLPWQSEVTLELNEVGDDGVTRFNFRDPAFLPSGKTFWISFYSTMRFNQNTRLMANAMYWVMLNTDEGSTPVEELLHGQVNHNFVFRDITNRLRQGWVNWTDGAVIESAGQIADPTHNLAFSLFFTCLSLPPPPPSVPSPPPSPEGEASPSNISVQTERPSLITDNVSNENATREGNDDRAAWIAGISIPLFLFSFCSFLLIGTLVRRYYRWKANRNKNVHNSEQEATMKREEGEEEKEVSLFDSIDDSSTSSIVFTIDRTNPPLMNFSDTYGGIFTNVHTYVGEDSDISD